MKAHEAVKPSPAKSLSQTPRVRPIAYDVKMEVDP
jgi:hypothetical protein